MKEKKIEGHSDDFRSRRPTIKKKTIQPTNSTSIAARVLLLLVEKSKMSHVYPSEKSHMD